MGSDQWLSLESFYLQCCSKDCPTPPPKQKRSGLRSDDKIAEVEGDDESDTADGDERSTIDVPAVGDAD